MSHTRAGLLFALPNPTRTAVLLGAEEWAQSLEESGVAIIQDMNPDLVVAPASRAADAAATGAQSVILTGASASRALGSAGYKTAGFLPMPSVEQPSVLLPLNRPRAARYGLANLSVPSGITKRMRNFAAGLAVATGAPIPGAIVLGSRATGPDLPFPIRLGQELGLPSELDWLLVLGRAIERSAFFLFNHGSRKPSWVLKFSPDHTNPEPFLRDKRGLLVTESVGGALSEHTPQLIGVSTDGLLPITVESAALGAPIVYWLRAPGSHRRKRTVVESIARWLIEVQELTAVPGRAVDELRVLKLPDDIVTEVGVDVQSLVSGLDTLPGVIEHGDLDPTHVLVDGTSFTVIDWEEARRHGLPLADMAFFLSNAFAILDGELDDPKYGKREAFARLFRGESPSGPLLFQLISEARDVLGLPTDAVGPLLSLIWLRLAVGPRRHLAEVWFADPLLGVNWSAWQQTQ